MKVYIAQICENNYDCYPSTLGVWTNKEKAKLDLVQKFKDKQKYVGIDICNKSNEELGEIGTDYLPTAFKNSKLTILPFQIIERDDVITINSLEKTYDKYISFDITFEEFELQ